MATQKQVAAAQRQAAIERAAGINTKVVSVTKPVKQIVTKNPVQKVITQNKGQVYSNGKLVGNYGVGAEGEAKAKQAALGYTQKKGNILGKTDGSTYRNNFFTSKTVTRPVLSGGSMKTQLFAGPSNQNVTFETSQPFVEGQAPEMPPKYQPATTEISEPSTLRPVLSGTSSLGLEQGTDSSPYLTDKPEAPQSLQDLRRQEIDRYQSSIDATNQYYAQEIARIQELGRNETARQSSMAVGAGLAGSPFQQTMENNVAQATNEDVARLTTQRAQAVADLMIKAEDSANTIYENSLDRYDKQLDRYIDERDKELVAQENEQKAIKDAELSKIKTLAEANFSLDELPQDQYKQMLENAGISDFEARAIWAASTPEANAKYEIQNGLLVGMYYDPYTGKPVVSTTKLPAELSESANPEIATVEFDGKVYWYDKNNPLKEDGKPNLVELGTDTSYLKDTLNNAGSESIFSSTPLSTEEANAFGLPPDSTIEDAISAGIEPSEINTLVESLSARAQAVLDEPALLNNYTPTERGKIIDELANAGLNLDGLARSEISNATKDKLATFDSLLETSTSVGTLIDEGVKTGPIASRQQSVTTDLFGGNAPFTTLRSLVANMNSTLLNLRSGAAVTPEEYARLKGFLPLLTDQEDTIKTKIENFNNELRNAQKNFITRQTQTTTEAIESAKQNNETEEERALKEAGFTPEQIKDFLGEKQSFNSVGSDTKNSSPLGLAKSYLGLNAGNPKQARTLSAFFKKAGGVSIDPATTAWCAAFANSVLGASGIKGTGSLMAQSFLKFGTPVSKPTKGDIVIFERGAKGSGLGHVGFVDGINANGTIRVLGGNQNGTVSIQTYKTNRVLGYRRIDQESLKA